MDEDEPIDKQDHPSDNEEDLGDSCYQVSDTKQQVVDAISKYHQDLDRLCHSIISKQRESKSRQRRLQKQMKVIHEEYKSMKQAKEVWEKIICNCCTCNLDDSNWLFLR